MSLGVLLFLRYGFSSQRGKFVLLLNLGHVRGCFWLVRSVRYQLIVKINKS